MSAFNNQIVRILNDDVTVEDLRNELEEKTGIFLKMSHEGISLRKGR